MLKNFNVLLGKIWGEVEIPLRAKDLNKVNEV